MHNQRNKHAQVWMRLMALPQEYWTECTLREIASVVGTPLVLDNATLKRLFGHYARILVDIDFSKKIFHEILIEQEGGSYPVEVVYERILDFCSHCHTLGHDCTNCRWLYPRKEDMSKDKVAKGMTQIPTEKPQWVPIKENLSGTGSSIAFAAPKPTEPQINMIDVDGSTSAAPTLAQTFPCVSEEIPQGSLPSFPMLELASLDDVQADVLLDDVEQVNSESREELVIPWIQNAPVMHPSSDAHDDERSFIVDLEASISFGEMSQTQHFVAHDDVQTIPQDGSLVFRSIPDDTATFLEMERLAQNTNYTVEHSGTDENGDK